MPLTTASDWHLRYTQQAKWTHDLRAYLYQRAGLEEGLSVLDVGCGTGVLLDELSSRGLICYGLDIDNTHLVLAVNNAGKGRFTQADAHSLPYTPDTFNLVLCHFLLLWLADPTRMLAEAVRVTKPGGVVLALAEPDYGGRIDYPDSMAALGKWQTESLRKQGADPFMGRQLRALFHQAGLGNVETGVLGGQWSDTHDWEAWESEWQVLESDFSKLAGKDQTEELLNIKNQERSAYQNKERVLFVPTFYAWGIVS
ncbi:MAG: methyltransferase domain-containing protein [Anaerolineales bacterium]|nr:methyltransferase domain-containing protein [Anaerolineales bacterium]